MMLMWTCSNRRSNNEVDRKNKYLRNELPQNPEKFQKRQKPNTHQDLSMLSLISMTMNIPKQHRSRESRGKSCKDKQTNRRNQQ